MADAMAVYNAKANQVASLVGLPTTGAGGFLQIIITILQQLFAGGSGGLGSCFGGGGGTTPPPAVQQAVTNPTEYHIVGLRSIVRRNVRQIGLRRPIALAIQHVGQTTTPDETQAMYSYVNGGAAQDS